MQSPDGEFGIFFLNHAGDLDLRGGDHGDVNPLLGQDAEHGGGNPGMITHANADDGYLDDTDVTLHLFGPDPGDNILQEFQGALIIGAHNGKGHIGLTALRVLILDDHIDYDIGI